MFDYHGKRWEKRRERILKRDGWLCRERKRYGKKKPATHVHHIFPAEEYPQYAWCDWNLLSLCLSAHDEMHDRQTGAITERGKEWQRRVEPERIRWESERNTPPTSEKSASTCID